MFKHPIVDAPIVAHRGASADAPENTIEALRLAAKMGARWVETDVRLTADGGLVMMHDATLNRTTSGAGPVSLTRLADIQALDAGSWFSPDYAGAAVPTLSAYLAAAREAGLSLQVELKEVSGQEDALAEAVCATLRLEWPLGELGLYVSGFSERCMALCAKFAPEIPRCHALVAPPRDPAARLRETGCQILHVQPTYFDAAAGARLRESGVEFAVATINDAAEARRFLAEGAQSILTDYPALLDPAPE